jgi:hypothetical protein
VIVFFVVYFWTENASKNHVSAVAKVFVVDDGRHVPLEVEESRVSPERASNLATSVEEGIDDASPRN